MANEPVYNQQATAYLLRDDPKAVIRDFYSMMACAFSHSTFEPVEHRWTWGQFFGPPSTDGAWFELYRNMLVRESDADSLLLFQATPRDWLQDGKRIDIRRAPTYYGTLSASLQSRAAAGQISADLDTAFSRTPKTLLVRFRHPQGKPMRSVTINGENWTAIDREKEWVIIANPSRPRYAIVVQYLKDAGRLNGLGTVPNSGTGRSVAGREWDGISVPTRPIQGASPQRSPMKFQVPVLS